MKKVKIEKVVLSVSGVAEGLEKGYKLLELLTKLKPSKTKSKRRIPAFGIRPSLEVGAVVTIRKDYGDLLKRLFIAIDNTLKKSQVSNNSFSFGIKEYIEIPGMEYQRELGIIGLDVTIVFKRTGRRVRIRKIKRSKIPERQNITPQEIIKFMEENFQIKFK